MTSKFKRFLGFGTNTEKARDQLAKEIKKNPNKEERKKLLESDKGRILKFSWLLDKYKKFLDSNPKFTPENENKLHALLTAIIKNSRNYDSSYNLHVNLIIEGLSKDEELKKFLNQNLIDLLLENNLAGTAIVQRTNFGVTEETELEFCLNIISKNHVNEVFNELLSLKNGKDSDFQKKLIDEANNTEQYAELIIHLWRFNKGTVDIDDVISKFISKEKNPAQLRSVMEIFLNSFASSNRLSQANLISIIKNGCADLVAEKGNISSICVVTNATSILRELIDSGQQIDFKDYFLNKDPYSIFCNIKDLDIEYAIKLIQQDQAPFVLFFNKIFKEHSKPENIDKILSECFSKSQQDTLIDNLIYIYNIPSKYIKLILDYDSEKFSNITTFISHFEIKNAEDEEHLAKELIKKPVDDIAFNLKLFKFYKFAKDVAIQLIEANKLDDFSNNIESFENLDDEVVNVLLENHNQFFIIQKLSHFKNLSKETFENLNKYLKITSGYRVKESYRPIYENPDSFEESIHVDIGNELIEKDLWKEVLENITKYHDPEFKLQEKIILDNIGIEEIFSNLDSYRMFNEYLLVKLALENKFDDLLIREMKNLKVVSHSQIAKEFINFKLVPSFEANINKFLNLDSDVILQLYKLNKLDLILDNIPKFKKNTHNLIALLCLKEDRTIELFENHLKNLNSVDILYVAQKMKEMDQLYVITLYLDRFPKSIQDEINKML
jgi:hypothetical protein